MMTINKSDRRVRRVHVPERDVLDWFRNAAEHWQNRAVLSLPMITGLPKDVRVESVHHEPMARCFWFVIWSASFTEFPMGELIPDWEGFANARYETVEVRTDADRLREQWHEAAYVDECVQLTHPDGMSKEEIEKKMRDDVTGASLARKMPLRVWYYKAGDQANYEAVMKAAKETNDMRNILVSRYPSGGEQYVPAKETMTVLPPNAPIGTTEASIFNGGQPEFCEMPKELYDIPIVVEEIGLHNKSAAKRQ